MSNVIVLLYRLGWNPYHITTWYDPKGDRYSFSSLSGSSHLLIKELIDTYNSTSSLRASQHINGIWMQGGVAWTQTLAYSRSLKKDKQHCRLAAVETVLTASCWPYARVSIAFPSQSPICSRCQSVIEDDFHAFWGCEHNQAIEDEDVVNTSKYIPMARRGADIYP